MDLSTHTLTPSILYAAFGVYLDLIGGEALASNQSLYLCISLLRLHLNAFRGVRAISEFDWPFTPTLTSSRSFSTLIPCYRDFNLDKGRSLGFASASVDYSPVSDSLSLRLRDYWPLTSPTTATRRFIMQKARRHGKIAAPTACRRTVSGTFSLPCPGCFSPFPHGTIRYRSLTHI